MSIKSLYDYFRKEGMNEYGAVGLLCNIGGESEFQASNVENWANAKVGMTDEQYTKALDNRSITRYMFANVHKFGFGLCQWTYPTRKAAFYDFMKNNAKSFGDEMKQAEFIVKELKSGYKAVWNVLCNAKSVKEASDIVLHDYEQPADQSKQEEERRLAYSNKIYAAISVTEAKKDTKVTVELDVLKRGSIGEQVKTLQRLLIALGYSCGSYGADGDFGSATNTAVCKYQKANGLTADGIVGATTWTSLLK